MGKMGKNNARNALVLQSGLSMFHPFPILSIFFVILFLQTLFINKIMSKIFEINIKKLQDPIVIQTRRKKNETQSYILFKKAWI